MLTIEKAVDRYLRHQQLRNLAPGSLHKLRAILNGLAAHLEGRGRGSVGEVEHADLDAWLVRLHRRGLSASGRYERTNAAKRLFRWLKAEGEVLTDPAAGLKSPALPDKLLPAPPSAEELQRLLEGMPSRTPLELRDRALVELLWGCMLRRSEALALDLDDVDLDEGTVTVRKGKGSKGRVVPVPRKTADALAAYLAVRARLLSRRGDASCPAFFLSLGRGRMSGTNLGHLFRRLKEEGSIEGLHAHALRHAGAVHLLRGQADVRHVQELLGHSDIEVTKLYLRLVPSDLKRTYHAAFPVLRV